LARVDPKAFGIAVIDVGGHVAASGDSETPFSIQSISKVFTLTLALGKVGDRLWRRVGREPSGSPFNSIVQLEREQGVPRNPFINAGAIAVTDVILSGHQPRDTLGEILRFMQFLADDPSVTIDEAVAASEQRTGFRNIALANYMKSFGVLDNPVDLTLGVYFHQCAIAMSCRQLATAGRFLAHLGRNPSTGLSVVPPERARRINAVMLTCGHYDGSGEFAYRVGLPGKSGVGGGILAIAPGKASIAVWAPGLDSQGNSHLGRIALEALTKRLGWSIFGV
jgi:glutaminase